MQRVLLGGKLAVIAGVNNSGKSNVLLAAERVVAPFCVATASGQPVRIDELDRAQVELGSDPIPLEVSLAYVPARGRVEDIADMSRQRIVPGSRHYEVLEYFFKVLDRATSNNDESVVWLDWTVKNDGIRGLDPEKLNGMADALDRAGLRDEFGRVVRDIRSSSSTTAHNIEDLIGWLTREIEFPEIVVIPATRYITNDGNVTPDVRSTSGVGFTGLLQALQTPSAGRYRADRIRFAKINRFIQDVLEDDAAEIAVPFDSSTVHVSLDGRMLPLPNLGSGVEQLVLLATLATRYDDALICIEEPELHLHPVLLRKLVRYLLSSTSNRYLMSTHSAHLLDSPESIILSTTSTPDGGTEVHNLVDRINRAALSARLGYRASDLVQSNAIIWVEGPSDRIYLRSWISATDERLEEGIHYSILSYGGRLLSHLSASGTDSQEGTEEDFVSLVEINRNMAILLDSDKMAPSGEINETKKRILAEFVQAGAIAWLTAGREVENYVPAELFATAVSDVHRQVSISSARTSSPFSSRFSFVQSSGKVGAGKVRAPDKIRIAYSAVGRDPSVWDVLDLQERVHEIVGFIRRANDLATLR